MPRIRNWKDLTMYRPDKQSTFTHITPLFSDTIDWNLIQTHLPDIMRVVLSIKAGRITASTLLRKLGSYSKKNRLYQAFRELGRVIRSEFLLKYISSVEPSHVAALSPYLTQHINRFGRYDLNLEQRPPELIYDLWK